MMINKKVDMSIILLYLCLIVLAMGVIGFKADFHTDEYLSYALSNHIGTFTMEVVDGETYEPAVAPFLENYAADHENRFNYSNVWDNQEMDVHPPLYYALLHTICSFFPSTFSKWYAGIINIIFVILTFRVYRGMLKLYNKNEAIDKVASVIFVFSGGVLSGVSFLRMYVMAMCLITCVAYLFSKIIVLNENNLKNYVYMFILAVGCALTHYYCVLYLMASCLVLGIWMLYGHKYKQLIGFVFTMCGSAGVSLAVFPAMWEHIFSGYRGTESWDNLKIFSLKDLENRVKTFFQMLDLQEFGGILVYLIVGGVILLFLSPLFQDKIIETEEKEKKINCFFEWMLLVFPVITYFCLVSKSAVYLADRYIYPIYAVTLFLIIVGFGRLTCHWIQFIDLQISILVIMSVLIIVGTWSNMSWPYLYQNEAKRMGIIEEYENLNAIVVYDAIWKTQQMYPEMTYMNSSTFITEEEIGLLDDYKYKNDKEIFVLISWSNHESTLTEIMEKLPCVSKYEKLCEFGYHTVYRLFGEG